MFKKGAKWVVGKDSKLSLWFDKWLDRGPLRSLIAGPLNRGEDQIALKDVTGFSGWSWHGCSFSFPDRLISEIKVTFISFYAQNADRITWSSSPSGNFELKEAYKLASLEEEGQNTGSFDRDWIWNAFTIPKIKCFVWQCLHKSIPFSTVLAARGMDISPVCQPCKEGSESILYVLRDCHVARNLWISLSPPMAASNFFGLTTSEWLRQNCCNSKTSFTLDISWGIIFLFGIWTLWLNRNGVVFRHESGQRILKSDVLAKAMEFAYIGIHAKQTSNIRQIAISWRFPPLHGSSLTWMALRLAIRGRLCIALKLPVVIIELDAKLIVDLLQKPDDHRNCIEALVSDCKTKLGNIPKVQINHCYREANKCAATLARRGALLSQDFFIFLDLPAEVSLLLSLDSARVAYDHFVPV
ncbi:hypothetical protein SO802_033667 [Lithocarpus litseifolius]|uniref:Reverse transcriptase zinc-binding domain-containing protein n=1 Tax=Lithocarpus litseifolius TaxID=425828 RepID=A0AAW2BGF4_9ROSI